MRLQSERGYVLAMVVIAALLCGIVSYGLLGASIAQARQSRFYQTRAPAMYAAEAAVVWAQTQLLANPFWSSAAGNTDVAIGGVNVDVIMPACLQNPCESRRLQARVLY